MLPLTLLRYPGGKSKAIKILEKYLPNDIDLIISPFFGGGSFEIFCAIKKGITVKGFDLFEPLVNFWNCVLTDNLKLQVEIKLIHPINKEQFLEKRKSITNLKLDSYKRAALFFAINKSSFSGTTLSGGFSKQAAENRFNSSSINKVGMFKCENLIVELQDFKNLFKDLDTMKTKNTLIYLDPPYLIESKLYGNKGDMHLNFDHKLLAEFLLNINKDTCWMLCYNDNDYIRELYKDCKIISEKWNYSMSSSKKESSEVIIISKKLELELKK